VGRHLALLLLHVCKVLCRAKANVPNERWLYLDEILGFVLICYRAAH
jgi:hypothetical protein